MALVVRKGAYGSLISDEKNCVTMALLGMISGFRARLTGKGSMHGCNLKTSGS